MRRQLAVFWLALFLWLTGPAMPCLAQTAPDIARLTERARAGEAGAMIALGEAYLDGNGVRRDLDIAISLFTPLARINNADALYLLSFALRERDRPGDRDDALRYGVAALALAKQKRGWELEANIQSQLGFVYEKLNRFDEAVVAYDAAARIFERKLGRKHPQVGGAYMNLANGLAGAGRQEEALAATQRALQILANLADSDSGLLASLYQNQAISFQSLTRYGEALDALNKAQALLLKRGGPEDPGIASIHRSRSYVYTLLGRYQEGVAAAQSALALYDKMRSPDQNAVAATHNLLGLAYRGLDQHDQARAEFLTVVKILEGHGDAAHIEMTHPLINLGNVYDDLGQFENALTNYQKALKIMLGFYGPDHPDVAGMLARIGNTSLKLKRYDTALDYGLQALLIQSNATDADLNSQRYTFRLLARILGATRDRTSETMDSSAAALLFAKLAVNTHQQIRIRNSSLSSELSITLGESFQPSYHLLSDLLLEDGQFTEAQFVSSLLKQQEFYEFTRAGDGQSPKDRDIEPGSVRLTEAEQKFWTDLKVSMTPVARIAWDVHKLKAARVTTGAASLEDQNRLQELLTEREQAVQSFITSARNLIDRTRSEKLLTRNTPWDFGQRYTDKIQADLRAMSPNTVLLQVISLDDDLHLFVSAAGRETVYRKIAESRRDLTGKVSAAVAAVEDRSDNASAKLAVLYDLLIRPIRPELDAATTRDGADAPVLLLDLSGFLRYVPYAALYDGRHYLVEDFAPALYNPANPTKFEPMRRDRIAAAGFGVTREHPGFAALPGAARELAAVASIIGGTPKLDDAFTKKSLAKALAARTQILHIASHFRFRPGNETNSYLLLGNGDGLSLDQMRTQKQYTFRDIDLITFSACETALGAGAEGEEIESLGMLAQSKGASAVMSTLWQIADDSTAVLMTDFYDGLINQGLDKARALRRAQLALMRGKAEPSPQASRAMTVIEDTNGEAAAVPTAHPYYWSAFILMGNWM